MEMKIICCLILVFAYGATGAGKTHTMLGNGENQGIIFLTVMELYRRMDELRSAKKFEVSVSYLEVILKSHFEHCNSLKTFIFPSGLQRECSGSVSSI